MLASFLKKLFLGLAALVFFGSAHCAFAQTYYPRKLSIKCQQLANMNATGTFQFRSGTFPVAGAELSCTERELIATTVFQPPSADNWVLTIRLDDATHTVNTCFSSGPVSGPVRTSQTCSSGHTRATFKVAKAFLR